MSTTHTYVCGELSKFAVRKVSHKRIADSTLVGYNTEERSVSPSQVTISLLKFNSISTRLNVPTTTRIVKSLVFEFPSQFQNERPLDPEVVKRTEEIMGMRPLMPQPHLTEAPQNLVINLNKEQIVPQIQEQIRKMARLVHQSPESCTSKSDLAGTLNTLAMYMRNMDFAELKQLEQHILEESRSGMKSMEKIFYDLLTLVGTNPSTMLVIKKVKEGSLTMPVLTKMVSYTIRNVRYFLLTSDSQLS